jgi:hypothetical protein
MTRWTTEQAWQWYDQQPYLFGFNYVTSSAVNSTEMWQAETFDPETIDRELGWGANLGYNSCRVFLQFLVHQENPAGHLQRLEHFLKLAHNHGMSVMPILFDDCAFSGRQPYLGVQDAPRPGLHNSGWTPSPGHTLVTDTTQWPELKNYLHDILGCFANDPRIVCWDLYNEPGNANMGEKSLGLLEAAFAWAREIKVTQPLTVGVWRSELQRLWEVSVQQSDVVSFHNYEGLTKLVQDVEALGLHQRPLLCTEWLRRVEWRKPAPEVESLSVFDTHLPFFIEERIGCYQWGLVNGKTQTHIPWGSLEGSTEPEAWFHDLLRPDGQPYKIEELEFIRQHRATHLNASLLTHRKPDLD